MMCGIMYALYMALYMDMLLLYNINTTLKSRKYLEAPLNLYLEFERENQKMIHINIISISQNIFLIISLLALNCKVTSAKSTNFNQNFENVIRFKQNLESFYSFLFYLKVCCNFVNNLTQSNKYT